MANSTGIQDIRYWLMKAEPESRIEKGKDVKVSRYLTTIVFLNYSGRSIISQFSVDDFEAVKTTPWEGVRNHEAKNWQGAQRLYFLPPKIPKNSGGERARIVVVIFFSSLYFWCAI